MTQEKKQIKKAVPPATDPVSSAERVKFLARMRSSDAAERYAGWQSAGPMGADVINVLGELASSEDKGVALSATGAMEKIAHYAGRPGAQSEAQKVSSELLKIANSDRPRMVRSNALQLVGFIGDAKSVGGLVRQMKDKDLREDARLALERIPGSLSESALKALAKAADENKEPFAENVKQSIYNRALQPKTVGIKVVGR